MGSVRRAYSSIASRERVALRPLRPVPLLRTRPASDKIIPIDPMSPVSIGELFL